MNIDIKSLLLGSAAAMVVVSGAKAADAIVVEPEPVEYVRVCDAYGSGFFFIPGTETCIRLSGFIRSAYEKYYIDGTAEIATRTGTDKEVRGSISNVSVDRSFTLWGQRARLNIDTRNETEYGTLRALYRLEAGQSNVDEDIDMDIALISLAGFRAGFAGATYWTSNHGFGFVNAESVSSVASGAIYTDGYYGFDDATIFDYTWAADGFSVTVGAEDPRLSYSCSNLSNFEIPARVTGIGNCFGNATNNGGTDGRANFYAGFNYSGDGFGVAFTAVHDSIAVDQNANDGDVGGWAYKVSANLDLSDFIPGGGLAGYYMNDGDYDTDYLHTGLTTFNPEEIWGVAFNANLTDEVQFWANYWDVQGTAIAADGPAAKTFARHVARGNRSTTGDLQQFGVGLNWFPSTTPGLSIKAAYYTGEIEDAISPLGNFNGTQPTTRDAVVAEDVNADFDGFEVTVRRDF